MVRPGYASIEIAHSHLLSALISLRGICYSGADQKAGDGINNEAKLMQRND